MSDVTPYFDKINKIYSNNFRKVLSSFIKEKVTSHQLNPTFGYCLFDAGTEITERVFANVFNTEKAIVRPQIVSGTNALFLILNSLLRRGDLLLSITGEPYETLKSCIGTIKNYKGSLLNKGIRYSEINLIGRNVFDYEVELIKDAKVIWIQKSCGYSDRNTISNREIDRLIKLVKSYNPNCIVSVDNCYGELVEGDEPSDYCCDVLGGSLLKNPGGGLARTGGYIVGKSNIIEEISSNLIAPGLGFETTPNLGFTREILQGLFNSPNCVNEALKGNIYIARFLEILGIECEPKYSEPHYDIILKIKMKSEKLFDTFMNLIQEVSPIDSFITPTPFIQEGYSLPIVMAGGTFTPGSSIEFSADGFYTHPFNIYFQGGLYFEQSRILAEKLLSKL
jgi:cystathionine beta-lyase family protein involved in aluminum resistance